MSSGAVLAVIAPDNEEGTRAVILRWCRAVGERVEKDQPLLELETDKITVEVPAPAAGVLSAILKQEGSAVSSGDVLAQLRPEDFPAPVVASEDVKQGERAGKHESVMPRAPPSAERLSPAVRRLGAHRPP
jgi:2-oxoglutarate dehydrogenase E2 component (dihydrolipoamide succinyltransferase)